MNDFADVIIGIVDLNEKINYNTVLVCLMIYVIIFWGAVSWWVYKDSRERYVTSYVPMLIAILNYLLGIPFLILYLLVRPIPKDELEEWQEGGVNVPIVNFKGENGIEMSFELRIHPKKLAGDSSAAEMKVDVSFESDDSDKQVVLSPVKEIVNVENKKQLNNFFSSLSNLRTKLKKEKAPQPDSQSQDDSTKAPSTLPVEDGKSKKKKKKHKKHK